MGEYAEVFLTGTPLFDRDDPLLLDYLAHDLSGSRVRPNPDVLVTDAVDTLLGKHQWQELDRPTRLVYAEWSVGVGSPPAYTPERVVGFAAELPALQATELVPGVDHAASIMTRRGAAVVVAHLRAVLG